MSNTTPKNEFFTDAFPEVISEQQSILDAAGININLAAVVEKMNAVVPILPPALEIEIFSFYNPAASFADAYKNLQIKHNRSKKQRGKWKGQWR